MKTQKQILFLENSLSFSSVSSSLVFPILSASLSSSITSPSLRCAVCAARRPAGAPAEAGRQDGPQMPEQE